jgi:hypothetical protein
MPADAQKGGLRFSRRPGSRSVRSRRRVGRAARQRLSLPPVLFAAAGDFFQKAHRKEVPEPVDARIIGRVTILLVELAKPAIAVAAELIEPALVAGIVDGGGDASGALGRNQDVVVRRVLRRKLHHVSANPDAGGV